MFYISDNGIVTVTGGDDFILPVFINANNLWQPLKYELCPFTYLFFAIMEPNQPFDCGIVRKKFVPEDFPDGKILIPVSHSDTENLLPGTYTYEIKIMVISTDELGNKKEYISTIVPKRKLFILE